VELPGNDNVVGQIAGLGASVDVHLSISASVLCLAWWWNLCFAFSDNV
jgi:hypothetical protein